MEVTRERVAPRARVTLAKAAGAAALRALAAVLPERAAALAARAAVPERVAPRAPRVTLAKAGREEAWVVAAGWAALAAARVEPVLVADRTA